MRPKLTYDILKRHQKALYSVFYSVGTSEDFKKVFHCQAFGRAISLKEAIGSHAVSNPSLTKKIEDFANADENWKVIIKDILVNKNHFPNAVIPHRNSDFYVAKGQQETYFWVDERLEVTYEQTSGGFYLAKLMVDETSDSLLFNNGEDGWIEYGGPFARDNGSTFSKEVAEAYKNYLADKQILKD